MVWFLVIVVLVVIYNKERLPEMMSKIKDEVPHIVETSKKASKEIKEKATQIKVSNEKSTPKKSKENKEQ